jgi:23S rRNA (pseudouridine1915-N3)-methyltransferase
MAVKIKIISVGKLKEKYLNMGINEYLKRLSSYAKIDIIEVNDEKAPDNLSDSDIENIKNTEGDKILSKIDQDEHVIALAIEGKQRSSEELADEIDQLMTYGTSKICFIIGGSNGLGSNVYSRANALLSFSKMTFPHQLMRLILLEQIYRSFRIMKNEPYHK